MLHEGKLEDVKMNVEAHDEYGAIISWAEDFYYALEERPKIFRWLFKIIIGKYAWREFLGLIECMLIGGHIMLYYAGYGLEEQDYHKDKISLWGI